MQILLHQTVQENTKSCNWCFISVWSVSSPEHPDPLSERSPLIVSYLERPKALEVACRASVEKCKEKFKLVRVEKKDKEKTGENLFKEWVQQYNVHVAVLFIDQKL